MRFILRSCGICELRTGVIIMAIFNVVQFTFAIVRENSNFLSHELDDYFVDLEKLLEHQKWVRYLISAVYAGGIAASLSLLYVAVFRLARWRYVVKIAYCFQIAYVMVIGFYSVINFAVDVYLDLHKKDVLEITWTNNSTKSFNVTSEQFQNGTKITQSVKKEPLYDDSAFAFIVVGIIDLFISSFLLYVALTRKYELRVVVFVAAVWGFVMGFLAAISLCIGIVLGETGEVIYFAITTVIEVFFGYVIISYFKFMVMVVERGLDDVHMSYFPEEPVSDFSEVQMDEASDERPIMDDQDDFPMHSTDSKVALT